MRWPEEIKRTLVPANIALCSAIRDKMTNKVREQLRDIDIAGNSWRSLLGQILEMHCHCHSQIPSDIPLPYSILTNMHHLKCSCRVFDRKLVSALPMPFHEDAEASSTAGQEGQRPFVTVHAAC